MDWQLTTMGLAMGPIFAGLVRTPEEERDQRVIENARRKDAKEWKIVDDQMAKNRYLSGDTFTMGDIPLGVWA